MGIKKIDKQVWLLAVILLGLLVRLFNLGSQSLWITEARIVCFSQKPINELFDFSGAYRPLYLILAKLWITLFGTSEVSVRFLPVIFGVISLFFIYKTGELLFNKRTGLLSAFILSLSPFHVYFSRQGKGVYSLLVLLTLLSFLTMLKIIRENKWKYYIMNILLHILILLTHPLSLFWLFTQNACYFFSGSAKNTRRWLVSMLIIVFILIPWYFFIIAYKPDRYAANFFRPGLDIFPQIIEIFSCGGSRITGAGEGYYVSFANMISPWILTGVYVFIFLSAVFIKSGQVPSQNDQQKTKGIVRYKLVLMIWLLLPLILIYLYSIIVRPVYWPRYVIYSAPAYYLLLGYFISKQSIKQRTIILSLIVILSVFSLRNIYVPGRTGDYRQAINFLKENLGDNDTFIISPGEMMEVLWYYLEYDHHKILGCIDDQRGMKINDNWENDFEYNGHRVISLRFDQISQFSEQFNFERFNLGENKIWFFYSPWWALNSNSKFLDNFLNKKYYLKFEKLFAHDGFYIKCFVPRNKNTE
ncbi:MAG: glycosyltransferase family 39 protein [Candidatus Omnitrophica bacterium]|nr:glycosyltransferase family 39 protein [Candidatus Omnitrophota bacterium]